MVKKIVFVGPSAAGKSTLRKWLFEGENIFKLLENPLEPTFRYDQQLYHLINDLGIFDLAGQEFDDWFGSHQDIFDESDLIINIIDSRSAPKIILDYIDKALKIQTSRSKAADIFFLIHKIDLIDSIQQTKIARVIDELKNQKSKLENITFHWFFTSIKPSYLVSTVDAFVEIFKISGLDNAAKLDTNLIRINTELFHLLEQSKEISMNDLPSIFGKFFPKVAALIDSYLEAGFLAAVTEETGSERIAITEKGLDFYNNLLKNIEELFEEPTPQKVDKETKEISLPPDSHNLVPYWIYGIMISDTSGKTLFICETEKNSLIKILNRANNPQFDLELIPMFLNAMSKFAEEINVQGLTSFKVQGVNLQMSSLTHEDLTFTIFSNPELRIDMIQTEISRIFHDFLEDNAQAIMEFNKTGNATKFFAYKDIMLQKISDIMANYYEIVKGIAKFSITEAKRLYQEMNTVDEEKLSIEDQVKFKTLKVKLLETILAENAKEFLAIESQIRSYL